MGARLRQDGIDAVETHYGSAGMATHQPWEYGRKAATQLLSALSFRNVRRDGKETVTAAQPDQVPATSTLAAQTSAAAAWPSPAPASAPGPGGHPIHVNVAMLHRAINYRQLARGLAYPCRAPK